jgi:hypothetical protein
VHWVLQLFMLHQDVSVSNQVVFTVSTGFSATASFRLLFQLLQLAAGQLVI